MASLLGAAIGGGVDQIARSMGAVEAALFLGLMELLVWLNMPAAKLLGQAMTPCDDASPDVDRARTGDGLRPGRRRAADTTNVVPLNKPLLPMARRGMTQRQIAEATGLSKSTVQRRLAEERSAMDQRRTA